MCFIRFIDDENVRFRQNINAVNDLIGGVITKIGFGSLPFCSGLLWILFLNDLFYQNPQLKYSKSHLDIKIPKTQIIQSDTFAGSPCLDLCSYESFLNTHLFKVAFTDN